MGRSILGRLCGTLLLAASLSQARPAAAVTTVNPNLTDATFGNVSSVSTDLTKAESTCSFSGITTVPYSVTATGSGNGGAFTVANGSLLVPYEVQWAQTGNATSGTPLTANVALTNQAGGGLLSGLTCALGLLNATAIVIVRASSLQQAVAGTYGGTLSIILSSQ